MVISFIYKLHSEIELQCTKSQQAVPEHDSMLQVLEGKSQQKAEDGAILVMQALAYCTWNISIYTPYMCLAYLQTIQYKRVPLRKNYSTTAKECSRPHHAVTSPTYQVCDNMLYFMMNPYFNVTNSAIKWIECTGCIKTPLMFDTVHCGFL